RVLEARAQQAIAVGNFFPQTQQAVGSYTHTQLSQNMANNPAAFNQVLSPSALAQIPPSQIPRTTFSNWALSFNLSWELDFWGRLRRAIESANAGLDASVENYDDALVTLLADVGTNYVQFRVAQQRIKIARENVRIQQGVVDLAEQRFKAGTGT